MYYVDNRGEVMDNLPNQVKTWNGPAQVRQHKNPEFRKVAPVETVGTSPIARRTEEQ